MISRPRSSHGRSRLPWFVRLVSAAKRLEDFVGIVAIAMPKGGRVQPKIAGDIMAAVPGYSEFAAVVKRAACR
jgi:hypothetical protein